MTASRLAVLAAAASVVAWGLKAVAIGVAGGLDQSPLEGPLYLLGLVSIVVAFAALGVAVAGNRAVIVTIIGAVVGVLVGLADGPPEPWSLGALVLALVSQILSAAMTVLLVVLVTRLYLQLAAPQDELRAVFEVPNAP